jgi:hypothetical protein
MISPIEIHPGIPEFLHGRFGDFSHEAKQSEAKCFFQRRGAKNPKAAKGIFEPFIAMGAGNREGS